MGYIRETYEYVDETGRLLYQAVRMEPKDFRQRRPDPDQPQQWIWNLEGVRLVPYRLPQVLKERNLILVVEGEKDVATAEKLGFTVTTNAMGAGKWRPEFSDAFTGLDTLVILPDNDAPGRNHAQQVAEMSVGQVQHIKIVVLPDLPEKGDLSDWVRRSKDKRRCQQTLLALIHDAPDWTPPPVSQPDLPAPSPQRIKTLAEFVALFQDAKETKRGVRARCPAHDDQKASLSITEQDGKILIHCHAGCDPASIVQAVGLELKDLFLREVDPKAAASDVQFVKFWYEVTVNEGKETERLETKIDYGLFLEFLHKNGFGLLCQDDQVRIVRRLNNVVSNTVETRNLNYTIKQFVLGYLKRIKEKVVREQLLRQHGTFFSTAFLTALQPIDIEFYRDTRTCCTLFFQNGFLECHRQGKNVTCNFQPYPALQQCVWETHIIPMEYRGRHHPQPMIDGKQASVIERLFSFAATEYTGRGNEYQPSEVTNLDALMYAFGYLVHDYKDPANAKIVVCVDNNSERGDAKGGRGKSLFGESLRKIRKVAWEDGRTLKTDDNQFIFQTIDLDSQILFIDDVKSTFDFSVLYGASTGDMALEKKRGNRLLLNFARSPKLIVTSNTAMLGTGDSHERRWLILPFTDYFCASYTPLDEFKQRLFEEWDAAEWQRFYDFVLDCLQVYFLSAKPIQANLTTYQESKLKAELRSDELLDYFETYLQRDRLPYATPKKVFCEGFKTLNPHYAKSTQHWFTTKLNIYCQQREIAMNATAEAKDGRIFRNDKTGTDREEYLVFTKAEEQKP